jgi:mRNA turnover protein 4
LTSEQAQLLKLVGERTVDFKVRLKAVWDAATGEVEEVESGLEKGGPAASDDEGMSD